MLTLRAIVTMPDVPSLRTIPGPSAVQYVFVVSLGDVFRWAPNSSATDDGVTAIVPTTGGFPGAWILVRSGQTNPVGLANADQHVNVGLGSWFTAAAFTAPHAVTLDVTNAAAGDEIELLNPSAYVATMVNGGPAAGTVRALPASAWCVAHFNGTDWIYRRSALLA